MVPSPNPPDSVSQVLALQVCAPLPGEKRHALLGRWCLAAGEVSRPGKAAAVGKASLFSSHREKRCGGQPGVPRLSKWHCLWFYCGTRCLRPGAAGEVTRNAFKEESVNE